MCKAYPFRSRVLSWPTIETKDAHAPQVQENVYNGAVIYGCRFVVDLLCDVWAVFHQSGWSLLFWDPKTQELPLLIIRKPTSQESWDLRSARISLVGFAER